MTAQGTYRAAIIGCGRKGATLDDERRCRVNYSIPPDAHAAAYQQVPGVQLVAAADPNESKRRLMQERWEVPRVFPDYRELLAEEEIELLSVTTRAPLHADVTIAAAEAGVRGVLCEKPMAVSLQQADAMIEACERSGTVLVVNHTRRWHPTYKDAAAVLRDGAIGELRSIVCLCPAPLLHNGTHVFDLMRLFGGHVTEVSGHLQMGDDPSADVGGSATLRFAGGAVAFVHVDSPLGVSVELQGTQGRLLIDPAEPGLEVWTYERPPRPDTARWYQGGPCPERRVARHERTDAHGTLLQAIEELIAGVEGRAAPRSGGGDGRAALELAMAVYESAAAGGRPVRLPLERRDRMILAR